MPENRTAGVYAIINTNLDIIEPFRPVDDIKKYLEELRSEIGWLFYLCKEGISDILIPVILYPISFVSR